VNLRSSFKKLISKTHVLGSTRVIYLANNDAVGWDDRIAKETINNPGVPTIAWYRFGLP
jgi:hypothetical protein